MLTCTQTSLLFSTPTLTFSLQIMRNLTSLYLKRQEMINCSLSKGTPCSTEICPNVLASQVVKMQVAFDRTHLYKTLKSAVSFKGTKLVGLQHSTSENKNKCQPMPINGQGMLSKFKWCANLLAHHANILANLKTLKYFQLLLKLSHHSNVNLLNIII